MMADNQNPHGIVGDAEKKMVREFCQVHTPQIAFANTVNLGRLCGLLER